MTKMKLMAWAAVVMMCSVAIVGVGYSAYTGTYLNENNVSTVTQRAHTVGIWSGTSGNYSLVSNGGLVNDITYDVSSHTTGAGTTYSAESQEYTLIQDKYVFINGSQGMSTYTAGNVLMKISGFDPDYIDGSGITVKINETDMAGDTVTSNGDLSWIGVLRLGNTANECKLKVMMETEDKNSYTYNGFGNLSIDVRMMHSPYAGFYDRTLASADSVTVPSGTTEMVIGSAYVPSAAQTKVTVTFGTALPNNAKVYVGGVESTTTDYKVFDSASLNGGAVRIVLPSASNSEVSYGISVTTS